MIAEWFGDKDNAQYFWSLVRAPSTPSPAAAAAPPARGQQAPPRHFVRHTAQG